LKYKRQTFQGRDFLREFLDANVNINTCVCEFLDPWVLPVGETDAGIPLAEAIIYMDGIPALDKPTINRRPQRGY